MPAASGSAVHKPRLRMIEAWERNTAKSGDSELRYADRGDPEPERDENRGSDPAERDVLEFAAEAGHILLENGAEIFRVEETIERICGHYHVYSEHLFVLSNGIFMTGDSKYRTSYATVQHIPVKAARLEKVVAVNQLSREIEAGIHTFDSAKARLQEIKELPPSPGSRRILASGIGSACFCFLFGGNGPDSAAAFLAGLLVYTAVLEMERVRLSKIVSNACGGIAAALVCVCCCEMGIGEHLDRMIVGAVIPLAPGVPFINGIRDFAGGDYISGSVRLLDAAVSFLGIAIGAGAMLTVYYAIMRKFLL